MKTDLFQSCGHCWVFQMCWNIECSTFTTSSFRIWNRSTGIPSPPLALFIVMLPKAHLTLHSRRSGSRWVITLSWLWRSLLGHEDLFLYSSSVHCCHFLISFASVRFIPFLRMSNYILVHFTYVTIFICQLYLSKTEKKDFFLKASREVWSWETKSWIPWSAVKSLQLCPTLWPQAPVSTGILQARILEWVAISFSTHDLSTT